MAPKLELVSSGTLTVKVTRPSEPPIPAGVMNGWNRDRTSGRQSWFHQSNPQQDIQVSYQVFRDVGQLESIRQKSLRNRSGRAVRGMARAEYGKIVDEGLTASNIASLAHAAAANASRKAIEGPCTVKVKRLTEPDGFAPICSRCKQTLAGHDLIEREEPDYSHGREATRLHQYYLCPVAHSRVDWGIRRIDDAPGRWDADDPGYELIQYNPDGSIEVLESGITWKAAQAKEHNLTLAARRAS